MKLEKQILFDPFNKQQLFLEAVFSTDKNICVFGGSIRSGKTFSGLGALILLSIKYPGSRWIIVRKDRPTLTRNTLPSWDKIKPVNSIMGFDYTSLTATFVNGSKIIFFAENYAQDKDLNRWKGLECNGFLLEEMNELQEISFSKAIERAGSYVIPNTKKQPKPLVMGTVNPSFGWVKTKIYDKFKTNELPSNIVFIESNIFDNTYISEEYKENLKSLPRYQYQVFVLGNWDVRLKTGGEFFKEFEPEKHIRPVLFDENLPLHVSIDANVLPYVTAVLFQVVVTDNIQEIVQIDELLMRDPYNSASTSGTKLARHLKGLKYNMPVFLYGDPTTKNRSAVDEHKRSFYDLFVKALTYGGYVVKDRFFRKPPVVIATGQFINDVFSEKYPHLSITIGENCSESINDYIESKEDVNGGILKTKTKNAKGQSYEKVGHISDCLRYMVCKTFEQEFKEYKKSISFSFRRGQFNNYDKNY